MLSTMCLKPRRFAASTSCCRRSCLSLRKTTKLPICLSRFFAVASSILPSSDSSSSFTSRANSMATGARPFSQIRQYGSPACSPVTFSGSKIVVILSPGCRPDFTGSAARVFATATDRKNATANQFRTMVLPPFISQYCLRSQAAFGGAAPTSNFFSPHSASFFFRNVSQALSISGTWQPPFPLQSLAPTNSPQPPSPLQSFWPPHECSLAVAQVPCPRHEFLPSLPCALHSFSPRHKCTSAAATVVTTPASPPLIFSSFLPQPITAPAAKPPKAALASL